MREVRPLWRISTLEDMDAGDFPGVILHNKHWHTGQFGQQLSLARCSTKRYPLNAPNNACISSST